MTVYKSAWLANTVCTRPEQRIDAQLTITRLSPPLKAPTMKATIWITFVLIPLVSASAQTTKQTDLPPRFQWESNYGYCGEVSFISAGLYYGQYVSQFDARVLANRTGNQNRESSQLLLGMNETTAAAGMHLNMTLWTGTGTAPFLAWVKKNVVAGNPVVIAVFTNSYVFYGDSGATAGSIEYDHIVPVHSISSMHPLSDTAYYPDDTLTLSDNGLYGTGTPAGSPYNFKYAFGQFPRTRAQANATTGPVYSLPLNTQNFGVALTGVKDTYRETVPVRVKTNVNYEIPEIVDGSNTRPVAKNITLTVTVSGLKPGVPYKLYRYNSMASVPDGSFNANASQASAVWPINIASGTSYTLSQTILSSQTAAYRAVPVSAR